MVFLVFLIPVALLFGAIYWLDSSNEAKIMAYLEQRQCTNISLHRAEYIAVCKDGVIVIKDFVFLDFDSNEETLYKDIASVEKVGNKVILHNKELELKQAEPRLYFGSQKETVEFQQSVNTKIKPKE
jgi:hypothetical protein